MLGGGGGILSGVEVIYPPHHKLQSFGTPDREALHHTLTMIGGGGPEKASFRLSFQPPQASRIRH